MKIVQIAAVSGLTLAALSCGSKSGGLSPEGGLRSLKMGEDFRAELFAAEPEVLDPVDMVFDERGRAFVADMLDLPNDPPKGKPARSRIVMLEDTDGDGRADRSTVFAENVLQVSGLMAWKGGLIVPAAPEILYLKDTDGDGKADVREVWYQGFFQGNPEAQITNPRLGIDNWIYFSNTGNAGRITSPKHPQLPPLEVRGADFRYHPGRGLAEAASGAAQYGSTFDDWGNRFISQNTTHLRHVVVPMQYLRRAPMLEVASVNHDPYGKQERRMWPLTAPQEWRVKRTELRQKRYDENRTGRKEYVGGYFSGATGSTAYTGDAWPAEYRGNIFTGDVSGNLVRRDIVEPDGATFQARPAREGTEFLASTDTWFRPTNFANAPDGNLYVMDMYREIIETPLSIPEELKKGLDFYSGDKQGRIYRIVSNQARVRRGLGERLDKLSTLELVKLFEHENGWHRQTAQRLLVERQEKGAADALRAMTKSRRPLGRLHALWTLEGIGLLNEADVLAALTDEHPGVREHAVRMSEAVQRSAALDAALGKAARDPALRVRYQAAFTLGSPGASPAAKLALVELGKEEDPWLQIAVLTSIESWAGEYSTRLGESAPEGMQRGLGQVIGTRRKGDEIGGFLSRAKSAAALEGLARGLELGRGAKVRAPGAEAALNRWLSGADVTAVGSAWRVARYLEAPAISARALRDSMDDKVSPGRRAAAASALAGDRAALERLLATNPPTEVQVAAIAAMAESGADAVLSRWKSLAPEARVRGLAAILSRGHSAAVLTAIEKGQVDAASVEIGARARLFEDRDAAIAERARKAFASAGGDRAKVVAAYRDALQLKGDVARGKLLFEDACAKCHLPRRSGARVGPDLSGISSKSKEELLEAILNPSASIEPRFVNYIVTTNDGRVFDGVLAGETPGAITLRSGSEADVTVLRGEIKEIRSSSISLMPEDLEKGVSKQGIADLIAYLIGGL